VYYPPRRRPLVNTGELDALNAAEPATVPGSIRGYRWWTLPAPDFRGSPAHAERDWPHARLHGYRASWEPGVNHAACLYDAHDPALTAAKGCGCGFWSKWALSDEDKITSDGLIPVCGVIRGFGRTRTGSLGSRVAKARILAVHLPFTLIPSQSLGVNDAWARAGFTGRVFGDAGRYRDLEPTQEDRDHSEAWLAVIGDRIEQDYPGVRVFQDRDAMLAAFPPDPVYAHQPVRCRWCGRLDCPEPGWHI
jgi:hypothetical protein